MAQTILKVDGMACNGCRSKVEKALAGISGVTSVTVDLESKQAVITGPDNYAEYTKTVENLGFTIKE